MIVIEGFDCSGKSTLAGHLATEYDMEHVHPGGPTHSMLDTVFSLNRCKKRFRERVVQDRVTHVSEIVYCMTRHPDRAGVAMHRLHEIVAADAVIYCRLPTDFLLDQFRMHNPKEHDDRSRFEDVRSNALEYILRYDAVMAAIQCLRPVDTFNRLSDSYDTIMDLVNRRLPSE